MKKRSLIILITIVVIVLASILIFGFLVKPNINSITECKNNPVYNSGLTAIDNCHKNCCEQPYFLKSKCDESCNLIN